MTPQQKNGANVGVLASCAVMMAFFLGQVPFVINPMMSSIYAMFPDIPQATVAYVGTIHALICIPFSLIAGAVAGSKIKYRTLMLLSIAILLLGGLIPFFTTDFAVLLFSRGLLGMGVGLATPIGNALVAKLYHGPRQATMQGIGMAVQNLSGVVVQLLSGWLVGVSVGACWLLHLILIVPLVLVLFFFKEPEPDLPVESHIDRTETSTTQKRRTPLSVWLYCIMYGVMFMGYYALLLNMSSIITSEGIGDTALAGALGSVYSVGGMVAGVTFGAIYKVLGRRWTVPVGMALITAGLFLAAFTPNAILMAVAVFASSMGVFYIWPGAITEFGFICPSERIAFASGLWFAMLEVGNFLAAPFMSLVATFMGTGLREPILAGAVLNVVVLVVWTVIVFANCKKNVNAEAAQEA